MQQTARANWVNYVNTFLLQSFDYYSSFPLGNGNSVLVTRTEAGVTMMTIHIKTKMLDGAKPVVR